MSKAFTNDIPGDSLDKKLHYTPANEPSAAVTPKTPQDGLSLASGTRDVPSRHTKLVIKSSGLPTVQTTLGSNANASHTSLFVTSNITQSPTGEIGLTPVSPTESTEEVASSAADFDPSLFGAARILAGISSNPRNQSVANVAQGIYATTNHLSSIPEPPWMLPRYEDDQWAGDTEGGLPEESEFSSGIDGDENSEIDSPIFWDLNTPGFYAAIPANDQVHSQTAQEVSTPEDQAPGLPFPDDRDMLVDYLERGLSLRYLFPKVGSEKEGKIVCLARLMLIGGIWKHTSAVCGSEEKTFESYQRHIKSTHLRISRSPKSSLSLRKIIESWNYKDRAIGSQDKRLWVRPWNQTAQPFPLVEKADLEA